MASQPKKKPARGSAAGGESSQRIDLGERLKSIRKDRGWTLQVMANHVQLAVSTLSKIENRQMSLTYESLLKVANGLGIDISDLLSDVPISRVGNRMTVSLRSEGPLMPNRNYRSEYLCNDLPDKRMVPLLTEVTATSMKAFGPFNHHPGEEFVWVASGTVVLRLEGRAPVLLHQGDSAYFDSQIGHAILKIGRAKAMIINVIAAPLATVLAAGERHAPARAPRS